MRVQLNGIRKKFEKRTVLDIGELKFESGKIYAILGPNGSGKTTMLNVISGIEEPDAGEVIYDLVNIIPKERMAYLPQKPYMFSLMVGENVGLGIRDNCEQEKIVLDALERVGMVEFREAKANSLSGGEAQRVAVARTLVLGKSLVLLDEPASSIDILSSKLIEDYIKFVNKRDESTIIFTTHMLSQAMNIADEVLVIWDGRVIEKGKPLDVLNSPAKEETKRFLENWRGIM